MNQTEAPIAVDSAARLEALDTRRSFIVQAPAGSGKTELLTQCFLCLLSVVGEPDEVLAITFTRAATAEMRNRVLDALDKATQTPELAGEAARAALANSISHNWKLLEQPQRLNIQTIDSLCMRIAHEAPLLSRLGGSLTPQEHVEPLYALAARRTIARLGGPHDELSAAIGSLLELRGASLADCEHLIAGMLSQRDQWGRLLYPDLGDGTDEESNWRKVEQTLVAPFEREHERVLARARACFAGMPESTAELFELLQYACRNLPDSSATAGILRLQNFTGLHQLTEHDHWKCICDFLLTSGDSWRKRVNKDNGFPAGGRKGKTSFENAQKRRFESLIAELSGSSELLEILCELRGLPPTRYSPEQWTLLRHILLLLRYAIAELRVIFAEENVIDFVELGLAAGQVLSNEADNLPRDLVRRWPHLLVDEFQDTSRGQYNLLSLLVGAWEGAGSCFVVGDPMQSIYGFRQAEVELFERTRRHGLGENEARISLQPLELQMNFRSHAGLVDKLNAIFGTIFAGPEQGNSYHVAFSPSIASNPAPGTGESVRVWAQFLPEKPTPEEMEAAGNAEAEEVLRIVRAHSAALEAADKENRPFRIAVLVRAKNHLARIARLLRDAAIPFRAIEIEELGRRQEVLDLMALTRALLQPMDRIAWLSVLRAPWCGLTLQDLHLLCGSDDPALYKSPVLRLLRMRSALLSEDGRQRASRVGEVLENALAGKHHHASFSHWVERTWLTLGGRACVDRTGYANARSFFRMMEELPPDGTQLKAQVEILFAEPDPKASDQSGVQLMTIHKAKGLGFDVVIVPGLERQTSRDRQSLLAWMERTELVGKEEDERHEFLVAPIGRKGEASELLYSWIIRQKTRKQAEEAKRLLYVACTRAIQELHLLATATVKENGNGTEITPGRGDSLLKTAWPALQNIFLESFLASRKKEEQAHAQATLPFAAAESAGRQALRRLAADWRFAPGEPFSAGLSPTDKLPEQISHTPQSRAGMERPLGSLRSRALGVGVHALLEELIEELGGCLANEPPETQALERCSLSLARRVAGWRPRAIALLRHAGLSGMDAEATAPKVLQALKLTLEDEKGRWILAAREGASAEISWSARVEPESNSASSTTLRADRVFRAGETVLSTGNSHFWIVDYKTAHHGVDGLDAFLAEEREKYSSQLETYGRILRQIHGGEIAIRLALYFPLMQQLISWPG